MITQQLTDPQSIAVVGASNDLRKPGGKILYNLIAHQFKGKLFAVNPKDPDIQGVTTVKYPEDLPQVDLAILAVPAAICGSIVQTLTRDKGTRGVIIISAGFSEENPQGKQLEYELVQIVNAAGCSLIGPNCIGVINQNYAGCFTTPVPKLDPHGVDFISGSGATAVYVMEASIPNGLTFSSVYSVGNCAQVGVEEILEHLDLTFDPLTSSRIKLLYLESIQHPEKLLKHASSLIRKGCRIAAIKAGYSEAGSRAASSHTGALATPDTAVNALFRKAGIVRCYSRSELVIMGGLFSYKPIRGKRMAIITHAGGPAVMLTDTLTEGGMEVPPIEGAIEEELLSKMHPGSSASNPIDVLATGGVEQIEAAIDCVENKMDHIDGMCVIFGSPGLFSVEPVYRLLDKKISTCRKPIYPVLPSTINAAVEVDLFLSFGRVNFPDETHLGRALVLATHTPPPPLPDREAVEVNRTMVREVIERSPSGYLDPLAVQEIMDGAGIHRVQEAVITRAEQIHEVVEVTAFPWVMKVVGPLHKSDVGGVILHIGNVEEAEVAFTKLSAIQGCTGVLIQSMLTGMELFIGAKKEVGFGHLVFMGLGGIMVEVLKDVRYGLVPLTRTEICELLHELKGYEILKGIRGNDGISIPDYVETIAHVSKLIEIAPEIVEMDLNPLLGNKNGVIAVDARIRIEK